MCRSLLNGCWPTHGTPSPPICVKPTVDRSIQTVMKWQPIPAMAREPSGTLVLVLCGQPEQNQGCRSPSLISALARFTSSTCMALSLALRMANCALMRAATSVSTPISVIRLAIARAMMAGDKSAFARKRVLAFGLAMPHSPPLPKPEPSVSISLNLPSTRGRTSERQLYKPSFN